MIKDSRSITILNEVVGEVLNAGAALPAHNGLIIEADEDALVRLHGNEAGGALASDDGSRVGLDGHVTSLSDVSTARVEQVGVVEGAHESLCLIDADLRLGGLCPH